MIPNIATCGQPGAGYTIGVGDGWGGGEVYCGWGRRAGIVDCWRWKRERKIAGRDVVWEIPVAGIYDDPDSDGRDQQFMDLQTFFRPNSFQQDKTYPQ